MSDSDSADVYIHRSDRAEPRKVGPIDQLIGAKIQECRKAAGISSQKLGQQLGITAQQMRKYESGTSRIAASTLYLVSASLKVPISQLLPIEKIYESPARKCANDIMNKLTDIDDTEFLITLKNFITVAVDRAVVSHRVNVKN
ncbi:MAG: helix-turn-helix transcriptional regulator [Microvirga sp.]